MVADVGDEHVQVGVAVVVADGKPHPRPDDVEAHLVRDVGKPDAVRIGVVAEDVQDVAVVGQPQVGVAVVVVVEEEHGMGLRRGVADDVAQPVPDPGVPALVDVAGGGVGERTGSPPASRMAIWLPRTPASSATSVKVRSPLFIYSTL